MKILIVNLRIGTGSVGRIVSDLYHGIVESGNECKVAYARGGLGGLPIEDTLKICSDVEVKKHALLTRLFGNTAFYSKKSTSLFLKEVDKYKPDIIHIHGIYGYYINMELLFNYIKENNIKLVSTLHSCWDFTGHCCYFDYINCEQWKTGCNSCKQKKSYPKSFIDNPQRNYKIKRELYQQIDECIIVTPSNWLLSLVKQSFLKEKSAKVIPNGIDLSEFNLKTKTHNYDFINDNSPIILCVASIWDRRKGYKDVLELSENLPSNIRLVMVGLSDKQMSVLPKNIIGIKRTNNVHELAELYSKATVFFNPTYEDNYPTVNLEAIACGTPVITYDTGGSAESLFGRKYGQVIEKRDYEALIRYSKKIYSNEINYDFSKLENISNNTMIRKYLEVYHNLYGGY